MEVILLLRLLLLLQVEEVVVEVILLLRLRLLQVVEEVEVIHHLLQFLLREEEVVGCLDKFQNLLWMGV